MEIIRWDGILETGVLEIDGQHRRLVQLINQLAEQYVSGVVDLSEVSDELIEYAGYHFIVEEGYWSDGLPLEVQNEHKEMHGRFVDRVMEVIGTKSGEQVIGFLVDWLVYHIIDSDKRLALIISKIRSGLEYEDAVIEANTEIERDMSGVLSSILAMYSSMTRQALELMTEKRRSLELERKLRASEQKEILISDIILRNIPGLLVIRKDGIDVRCNAKYLEIGDRLDGNELEIGGRYYKIERVEVSGYEVVCATDITEVRKITSDYYIALTSIVRAISKTLEMRDPYTAGHQQRVAKLTREIAIGLGLSDFEIEGITLGACIHDIGKLAIPIELLVKPTKLSDIEYRLIKQHVEAGREILSGIEFPWPLLEMVEQHHERLDGKGYPNGLIGEEICIGARIIAVVDTYDAMACNRPYRMAVGKERAIEELISGRGTKYDKDVVDCLIGIVS